MKLKNSLEDLREELNIAVVDNNRNLSNKDIVDLSQQLDKLIVLEQKRNYERWKINIPGRN